MQLRYRRFSVPGVQKSKEPVTGLEDKGPLKALNDQRGQLCFNTYLGPISLRLEPSEVPYFPNKELVRYFFDTRYSKAAQV